MAMTVSDQMLQRLHAWGIRRIYGYPGDGINGLMGAFGRMGDKMEFVQARWACAWPPRARAPSTC